MKLDEMVYGFSTLIGSIGTCFEECASFGSDSRALNDAKVLWPSIIRSVPASIDMI